MRSDSTRVVRLGFILVGCLAIAWPWSQTTASAQGSPRILLGDETDDYESVGIVGSLRRGGFCSGTLITDSHVLTAAHCAEVIEGPTNGTFEVFGSVYETIDIFVHPDYNPRTLSNDIAILQLNQPVTEVLPSEIFRGEPLVGDLLFIVGYGGTGTAQGGSDGTFGTKRVGTTTIDSVTRSLVSWNFEDDGEANTAAGDSGGPGYLDIDGDLFVASITSGGTEPDSSVGDFAFNTRVDAYADWIDLTITASLLPDQPSETPQGDDDPAADVDGDCDSFLSCLFGSSEVSPFPLLTFLIDALTAILDWLNELDAQAEAGDGIEPADGEPADQPATEDPDTGDPETEDPGTQDPGAEQPADCPTGGVPVTEDPVAEDPVTEDPATEDPGTEEPATEDPTTEDPPPQDPVVQDPPSDTPVILDPITGEPITIPPIGDLPTLPDGVELPPLDATNLEIRRWMLENPSLRDLVKHRL